MIIAKEKNHTHKTIKQAKDTTTQTVCVIDASGHLGFNLVQRLLHRGYTVHASIQKYDKITEKEEKYRTDPWREENGEGGPRSKGPERGRNVERRREAERSRRWRDEGRDVRAKEGATRGSVTVARRRPQWRSDSGATEATTRAGRWRDGGCFLFEGGATVAASFSPTVRWRSKTGDPNFVDGGVSTSSSDSSIEATLFMPLSKNMRKKRSTEQTLGEKRMARVDQGVRDLNGEGTLNEDEKLNEVVDRARRRARRTRERGRNQRQRDGGAQEAAMEERQWRDGGHNEGWTGGATVAASFSPTVRWRSKTGDPNFVDGGVISDGEGES
ncbi:hypothetical protein DEO72_LG10g2058 [Vigna unguiculata]|uniref:Uncharacterized protein n=1 Tax=Vigna unguiculata TaxID=3917 RepID=A0A4D6NAR1_VIGUN|nr:hypothetical protein DEO72_LG10g2058 [Vigna unguiculata]